ncbi:hypothetical protein PHYSODRAFT_284423 [Phytophthora sojae]|uniref:RxLR effector protein n=2 Tax=Phytophthora sojae TaxID=67593 RepID=G4YQ40_PHYSP|nr:hypothetical protein PHYSODRAFT_284423 [Phytophthora sojae]AEK81019.1 Avh246 [Phytophthora sojae]AEK81020.1 Avh246 [Phytophthora sojae]AEK81021.1 Avh246 [Phytophthora sojae]EGZ29355.1 hypothetical protein PHYSODRAFT_284423 [Phytophthora sojae]|eukprot:XP_009516630.1 hypothetical protein PHYSODRAFT_284423 [Phytophthora sojae]
MRTIVPLLLVAIASLASCSNLAVAERAIQDAKGLQNDNTARHLKGTPKRHVADEEERGAATQVISKLKSILGSNPDKKKLDKVRSYAEENPDKWLVMSYYLDYVYGISFLALLAGGAIWGYSPRPAGHGGPNTN